MVEVPTGADFASLKEKMELLLQAVMKIAPPDDSVEVYTTEHLCKKFTVSKKTLQKWRDEGKIAFTKVGRKIVYKKADVQAFINQHRHEPWQKREAQML